MDSFRARRRALLAALAMAGLSPPVAGQGQGRPKVLGYLSGGAKPAGVAKMLAAEGFVEGRNLRIETQVPPNWEAATLRRAAEALVALRPDALLAWHGNRVGALAAATRTIPIVAGGVPDPVGGGFAQSLRRPGGNVTGLSFGFPETAGIVIGILKALLPGLQRVAGVFPAGLAPEHRGVWWGKACREAGIEWVAIDVGQDTDLERSLAPMAGQAAFIAPQKDPALSASLVSVATRLRIATSGSVKDGALLVYGLDHTDAERRVAGIVARVLRGANPAEIPFELPDRPSFHFNRTTARVLGITLPPALKLRVTEFVD